MSAHSTVISDLHDSPEALQALATAVHILRRDTGRWPEHVELDHRLLHPTCEQCDTVYADTQAGALDGLRYRRHRPGAGAWAVSIGLWCVTIAFAVLSFARADGWSLVYAGLGTVVVGSLVAGATWLAVGGVEYVSDGEPSRTS